MRFDLKSEYKVQGAKEYFNKLISEKAMCEIREIKLKRSLDQNSLYWLWLTVIQKEIGLDKNESHCSYRALFLRRDDEYITNLIRRDIWNILENKINSFNYFPELKDIIDYISYSTTELDTKDFTDYLNKIREHARANMGVILLTQDDKEFEAFYREYGFYS
jgi:hypothetical protein